MTRPFRPDWRADPYRGFDVKDTATGRGTTPWTARDRTYQVYRNVNLSVYSAQTCNAKCPFCVEELRPASRGTELAVQKAVETDDESYFAALDAVLAATKSLNPSLSITGGEPSKDPRLPRIVETLALAEARKRTVTTNASGLLDLLPGGDDVLHRVLVAGLDHLNISRAHWDEAINQRIMRISPAMPNAPLHEVLTRTLADGTRPRLSCVLLRGVVDDLDSCVRYLDWAAAMGVDNVVFRQLMHYDRGTYADNYVTRYSDGYRAPLVPILEGILSSDGVADPRFTFVRQVMGYYYYVEVYRYAGPFGAVDVCLEGADLALLEARKLEDQGRDDSTPTIHELIFHPNGALCSTWQPWDGQIAI